MAKRKRARHLDEDDEDEDDGPLVRLHISRETFERMENKSRAAGFALNNELKTDEQGTFIEVDEEVYAFVHDAMQQHGLSEDAAVNLLADATDRAERESIGKFGIGRKVH